MEVDDRARSFFSQADFGSLLSRFVRDGGVAYEAWSRDIDALRQLDAYLERVARVSPASNPNLFSTPADRVLYWICAHNAFVIREVLSHWPVASVLELAPGWEARKGNRFFRRRVYTAGGRRVSLGIIRHRILPEESPRDARVLLLLNCGSASCPDLRPEAPTAASVDAVLALAAADFVADGRHLRIDNARRRIVVSPLLGRSRKFLLKDPRSAGRRGASGIASWLAGIAPPAKSPELALARDYRLSFQPWNWRLNVR
ncbi:MAG: DUF547 domain-containing protein [Gammaproteobacteria bacterium]